MLMNLKTSQICFSVFAAMVAVLLVLQGVKGFGSPSKKSGPAPVASPAGSIDIPVKDFAFPDAPVEVKVGTKAKWTNLDASKHTVSATDGSFDSGTLAKDQTFEFAFTKAGSFTYSCQIHETMKGTLVVT